jgi:hypothetical protein
MCRCVCGYSPEGGHAAYLLLDRLELQQERARLEARAEPDHRVQKVRLVRHVLRLRLVQPLGCLHTPDLLVRVYSRREH